MEGIEGAVFGSLYPGEDFGALMNYARITPPEPKTCYVDIAGGDSALDLTEALGGISYEDGAIAFKFTLFSAELAEKMKNSLHGKRMEIMLEREPDYLYDGRITVTKVERAGALHELYASARIRPYKQARRECLHVEVLEGGEKEVLLENDVMPSMPRIQVEGEICLTYGGSVYRMKSGDYQVPEVTLQEGLNRLKLSGSGTVRFIYRKGRLA